MKVWLLQYGVTIGVYSSEEAAQADAKAVPGSFVEKWPVDTKPTMVRKEVSKRP